MSFDTRKITIPFQARLVLSFFVVLLISGSVTTLVGIRSINQGVMREIRDKVKQDLNAAREIYTRRLDDIKHVVGYTAIRKRAVRDALVANDRKTLLQTLELARREGELDILTITDREGTVFLRARNPHVFGDSQKDDEIVGKVLERRTPLAATQIVPAEELAREGDDLARRAQMEIIPTPRAKPTDDKVRTSGMMLKAAAPVLDDSGELAGVLYGGSLINKDYRIVDRVKDTVYQGVTYNGKDIGTVTIFQGDLRISTNVRTREEARAIGTRVSEEVNDKVLGESGVWEGRAFVVNDWYVTKYEPIRNSDDDIIGILYVGVLEQKYKDMKNSTLWTFIGLAFLGIVLALVISYPLASTISRPIKRLNKAVEAMADGNFDLNVDIRTRDEIGVLDTSLNRVRQQLKNLYWKLQGEIEAADENLRKSNRELIEKQAQLIQSEKLASLGMLSAAVAHEINNPLSGILTYIQLLLRIITPENLSTARIEKVRKHLATMESETARCGKIVSNLLTFSRQAKVDVKDSDLNEIVERSLFLLENKLGLQNIIVETWLNRKIPMVPFDAGQIQQVLMNLIINAAEAMQNGGNLKITTSQSKDGEFVQLRVADDGVGIPKDVLQRLFDPFFTTKTKGKGIGLGLSVAYGIVKEHRGSIQVESDEGAGTTFVISLPKNPSDHDHTA